MARTHIEYEASATWQSIEYSPENSDSLSLAPLDKRLEDFSPGFGDQFGEIAELFDRLAPSVGELFSQLLAHIMDALEKETEFWFRQDCGRVQACHQSTQVAMEATFVELRAELNNGTVIESRAMHMKFEAHFEAAGVSRFLPDLERLTS